MKEKIEAIRQKCIEANPSILDLVFGCEIDIGGVNWVLLKKDGEMRIIYLLRRDTCFIWQITETELELLRLVKNIGRPIRLADVLVMAGREWELVNNGTMPQQIIKIIYLWNLHTDDLTKQSPETIDFLFSILIV